jgi:hypothetical protein
VIGDALLIASTFAFIFAIADVLLSDDQKRRMDVLTTRLWNKLDDYKTYSLWPVFRSHRFRTVVFLVGLITPLAAMALTPDDPTVERQPITFNDVFVTLIIACISSLVAILSLAWVTSASKRPTVAIRAVLVLAIVIPAFLFCMPFLAKPLLLMTSRPQPPGGFSQDYGVGGLGMIALMLLSILCMVIVMALPIAIVQLLRMSIVVGEFVVRRIAEYPKGTILAGSAIATAALGLFKALS